MSTQPEQQKPEITQRQLHNKIAESVVVCATLVRAKNASMMSLFSRGELEEALHNIIVPAFFMEFAMLVKREQLSRDTIHQIMITRMGEEVAAKIMAQVDALQDIQVEQPLEAMAALSASFRL